jgi:hypothetical protein
LGIKFWDPGSGHVQGIGFEVQGLVVVIRGLVQGVGIGGLGFRVWDMKAQGFGDYGLGCRM